MFLGRSIVTLSPNGKIMDELKPEARAPGPRRVQVRATWEGSAIPEPVFIDQVHLQHISDYYYLTFGQATFPLAVEEGTPVDTPIRAVARFVLTENAFKTIRAVIERSK